MRHLSNIPVVILCGGKGSRMGNITQKIPKSLIEVHGKPILWYIILTLFEHGFRKFILPTGYLGEKIQQFCEKDLLFLDAQILLFDTGTETGISQRILQVKEKYFNIAFPNETDFLLCNGDTFFNFNMLEMYLLHKNTNSLLTLASTTVNSQYGLILEQNEAITSFARDITIRKMSTDSTGESAYIYSGICYANTTILTKNLLETSINFEHDIFPKIIAKKKSAHYKIKGYWYAIDTMKDLQVVNSTVKDSKINIKKVVQKVKNNLASRYSYKSKYIPNIEEFKKAIISKKIIPHQVEVQPGPISKKNLCWLKCPYCYGGSAKDSGERLPLERYKEIMHEIANGGVKKIIFAGYTTDPLNYEYIEDLVKIPYEHKQIIGFHTKALRVSDNLTTIICSCGIQPMSYFSVSVDAGSNNTYNIVHGVKNSHGKLFDNVIKNIEKITNKRANNQSKIDISATYLINNFNCNHTEIRNAIISLRNAGVDLVRFTFPQVPKGYDQNANDLFIPSQDQVEFIYKETVQLIEGMSNDSCQTLIMDLDSDHEIKDIERTLPCYARFVFPSIGFDGWLSHCSESSSPHFRPITLGDLRKRGFWEIFYNYDSSKISASIEESSKKMTHLGCRCDRKEHVVNLFLKNLKW